MSTLGDRMLWTPATPAPPLTLEDVLLMLDVHDQPELEQRRRALDAATHGELGRPSLDALRRAGWLDFAPLPRPAESGGVPTVLELAVNSLDEWQRLASERQAATGDARAKTRTRKWVLRALFAAVVVATAVIVVLFGNDVVTSAAVSGVTAVISASSLLLTAEKWNEAALRDESMRSVLRRLGELQLEIDEARWRIAADRRPESVELTMERVRRDYEHAMQAEAADPSVA